MHDQNRRRPTTLEDSVFGVEHDRPDPYRRVLSSDDQYWSGYFDGAPAHNAIRGTRATQLASDPTITPQQAGMLLGHSVAVARRNYVSVDERLLERLSV